jgi:hypothetical protein
MILGMTTETFTLLHVIVSLIGIVSGLVVVFGLLSGKRLNGLTLLFLITTALTSLSGFAFPNTHITPGIILGILSLVVLALATPARYVFHLAGGWRTTYAVGTVVALYFNVFVLIAQAFQKIPALKSLAPAGFLAAQLIVMALFVWLGIRAVRGFRNS